MIDHSKYLPWESGKWEPTYDKYHYITLTVITWIDKKNTKINK